MKRSIVFLLNTQSITNYLSPESVNEYLIWMMMAHYCVVESAPTCGKRVLGKQDYCWTGSSRNWIWEREFTAKYDNKEESRMWRLFASSRGFTLEVEDKKDPWGKHMNIIAQQAFDDFLQVWTKADEKYGSWPHCDENLENRRNMYKDKVI